MSNVFQGRRTYGAVPNFPKEEFWVCSCGHKNKSCTGLVSHITKMDKNPWFKEDDHKFQYLMKHGTRYSDPKEALDKAED